MKLYILLLIFFQLIFISKSTNQNLLSNQEIKEILKCFGDLDLEEGCVICRYVTQKIYKVLDISSMCPDVVNTKLLTQRQREWKPDPQTINKWTVLFNLQKDYMERIKPEIDNVKNYDKQIHQKLLKEKIERENLSNLIQFQNKVNSDLAHTSNPYSNEFTKDHCDDEDQKYKHLQAIAPQTGIITNPRQTMLQNDRILNNNNSNPSPPKNDKFYSSANSNALKNKMKNFINSSKITDKKSLDYLNKELLKQKMAQFFVTPTTNNFDVIHDDLHPIDYNDPHLIVHHEMPSIVNYNKNLNNFKFKERKQEDFDGIKNNINAGENNFSNLQFQTNFNRISSKNSFKDFKMPPKTIDPFHPFYLNEKQFDKNVIPQANFDFISKELKDSGNIQYLGSSIGNPYAGFKTNQMESKISDFVNRMSHKRKINKNHVNRRELERIKQRIINKSKQQLEKNKENQENNKNLDNVVKPTKHKVNDLSKNSSNLQKSTSFKQINNPVNNKGKISSVKIQNSEEIINKDDENVLNKRIENPPSFESFITTKEDVHFDKNFFTNLIEKSKNFNLETQRRGRRRSRFPDPQWDCAEMQVSKIVRYLCEEELSASYQKYCKPIFEQINTMIESYLYHDNNLEICQNIHMCPVTIDIHNDHTLE